MKRKTIRNQAYINLLLWIVVLVMLNFISSWFFTRIDLTSEKRYTLSDNTVKMLKDLDDVVYFKVYLEGDLNSGFTRLQNSVKEMLDEFRVYAGSNIEYEFIDPFKSKDEKTRNEIGRQLMQKGLMPTNLQEEDDEGKMSQKIIFPGALV
ncbi:MAG: Gldg family protein, partial [Bacteroidota bacterium]